MKTLQTTVLENIDCGMLGPLDLICVYVNRDFASPSALLMSAQVEFAIHDQHGKTHRYPFELIQQLRINGKITHIEELIEEEIIQRIDDDEFDTPEEAAGER